MARFRMPHTLTLLFSLIVVAWVATWLVPAGQLETSTNSHGREVVVPGTFEYLEDAKPPSALNILLVIPRALGEAQGISFFLFIVGGALSILRASGALDAGMGGLLRSTGSRPAVLILIGMLAFTIGSSTIGMAEEYFPLTAVLMGLCVAMRMDVVAAIGIMVVGYSIGFGAAALNPFTVLVAQEVAGLEPTSGAGFRMAMTVPFFILGYWQVYRYARRVRADASASLVADVPAAQPPQPSDEVPMTGTRRVILLLTLATLGLLVWGIKTHQWYFTELGAAFVGFALLVGLVARMSIDDIAKRFIEGASELTGTALLIGFARGIELMLSDGQVLHTIVNSLAQPLGELGSMFSAVAMLFIQSLLNLFVPSGSGQAYVTMPIMGPIGDLVGVSRQVAVLAYQMGDGFMNAIVPTNAVLMGILGIAGIPYSRWFRFIAPLMLQFLAVGCVVLMIAVAIGY